MSQHPHQVSAEGQHSTCWKREPEKPVSQHGILCPHHMIHKFVHYFGCLLENVYASKQFYTSIPLDTSLFSVTSGV